MKAIVLIDDDKDNLQFLREAIGREASKVRCLSFVFGEEAVEALLNGLIERPHMVFINLNMKDGLRLLQALRSSQRFDDLPMAAYAPQIHGKVRALPTETGLFFSFDKPNTINDWRIAVHEVLTSVQAPNVDLEVLIADSRNQLFYNNP